MRFKAVYEPGVGFNFPELDEELQYEVYKERQQGYFKTLISGLFDNGKFYLEYSPRLNFLMISYAEINSENERDITNMKLYLYKSLKEALADFEILKKKPNARWWQTTYYESDFQFDYVDPTEDHSKMIWRKKGVWWVAQGNNGRFLIKQLHRKYIGRYEGKEKNFNLPPKRKISEIKALCAENAYWEG